MADEGYKIQISAENDSGVMVNVRTDDEGELSLILTNLEESDSEGSRAVYAVIADGLDIKPKKKAKSKSKKKRDDDDDDDDSDDDDNDDDDDDDEDEKPKRRKAPKKKGSKSRRK